MERRWVNPSQPQTLQMAVFLLYIDAGLLVIQGGLLSPFFTLFIVGDAAGAFGMANERRWGYGLGLAMAFLPFVYRVINGQSPIAGMGILNLMFAIALVALLLHPQSRDYQRIWFK